MTNTTWTNGDISGSQTLNDLDHLYPVHINEIRVAVNTLESSTSSLPFVTVGLTGSGCDYICDGTADDVQIQAAIDSLSATLGGGIYIKNGLYDITNDIEITNPNVTIIGSGSGTILKLASTINRPIFQVKSTALSTVIENLKLDGTKSSNTVPDLGNHGIYTASSDGIFQNLTIINCYNGGIWVYQGSKNRILNNNIDGCGYMAIRINNYSHNNLVYGNNITNNTWGISLYDGGVNQPCIGNRVVNNYIYNCTGTDHTLAQSGISILNAPFSFIHGNTIESNYGRGMQLFGGSYSSIISNNNIRNCGLISQPTIEGIMTGCAGIDTGPDSYLQIINNHIQGCGDAGIWVSGNIYNIIQGNYCLNNGQNADSRSRGSGNGITLNFDPDTSYKHCSYNLVSNNYCMDLQASATQQYGIKEWMGDTTNYLNNNYIGNYTKGNVSGGILIVGSTCTKYGNTEI